MKTTMTLIFWGVTAVIFTLCMNAQAAGNTAIRTHAQESSR